MSDDLFQLDRIKEFTLDQRYLNRQIQVLAKLTGGKEESGDINAPDLIDDLRRRVRAGIEAGLSFDEYTAVKRRESLLLALYLNDLAEKSSREQLPPFNQAIGTSVLGEDPRSLKKHLRRLATQLYFTHYDEDRLPCLDWFANLLKNSWIRVTTTTGLDPAAAAWVMNAHLLFANDAPEKVASKWNGTLSVSHLAGQFHIHEGSLFRERLMEALILKRLQEAPQTGISGDLDQLVVQAKERRMRTGYPLGAVAVNILVDRSRKEFGARVPKAWREQLVSYACDPRIPSRLDRMKWWGWASPAEIDIAIRSLSELTLHEFIALLEKSLRGTSAQQQFEPRRDVLLKLFELGKVIDARLVVHQDIYWGMDARTRSVLRPSWVSGGPQHTSFICLRCSDDVFLIEGTHSFALRGFVGPRSFPIADFWESAPEQYLDGDLRVSEDQCMIHQRHQGDWIWGFERKLSNHGVIWRGL
jgi:hypothetical protein